uniref:NADH-ubiquinone oxidoreductase chain 5 n=1 Tax=Geryonia proboscidalis TaxID=497503 RepID=A0A0S2IB68_9CNID|nr:NADH dehydrogenase subunit 5 [Geryonia proboscidalis]
MYFLVILLPLLSWVVCCGFGRKVGEKGSGIISTGCLLLSLLISCLIFTEVSLENSSLENVLWNWFDIGLLNNPFGFYYDELTASMLIVVTTISSLVHLYSTSYMAGDPHLPRFMSYLSLFTFFMLILISSNNFVQLFIGWEGVGLCSYLLINFWYTRIQANKAGIKAMLVNRVGDVGMILAMILIWLNFGSLEFCVVFGTSSALGISDYSILLICIFLLIGATGKSAQLGLHTWLPDAMEGPTPVSALIHAATMVTAGVFLIIRSSPLFELSSSGLLLTTLIGSFTAFFAATVGLAQNDLKKVIAYSTCSQLGYMVMICGISNYSTGLFHLFNHAFFKALLFLSAGSIIHALFDEQDMRRMGSMKELTPFSFAAIFVGSVSLMGLPFLTGFYSKDFILELAFDKYLLSFALWLGLGAAFFTAFYSFRLIYFTFVEKPLSSKRALQKAHEGHWNLIAPLILLLVGSLAIGYSTQFFIIRDVSPPMIPTEDKWMPTILSIGGGVLGLYSYMSFKRGWKISLSSIYMVTYAFINAAWQFNYVINHFIVKPFWKFGLNISYNKVDRQLLEFLGPEGLLITLSKGSSKSSLFQSGWLMNYLLIFILFVTVYTYLL